MDQETEQKETTKNQSSKTNKILGIIGTVILAVLYLGAWYYALMFFTVLVIEGLHVNFNYAFGSFAASLIRVLGVAVFLSIIYLPIIYRKKTPLIGVLLAFALSIGYCVGFYVLDGVAVKKAKFSTEDWIAYPNVRPTLYYDLKKNYDLKGYTEEQVLELLGEPDDITPSGENMTYKYDDGKGNCTYVTFTDETLDYLYFID